MTDKIREEFKNWARSRGLSLPVNDEIHYNEWTQLAFEAWQASRAALVIELPKRDETPPISESTQKLQEWWHEGHDFALMKCKANIEAAGLKVSQ